MCYIICAYHVCISCVHIMCAYHVCISYVTSCVLFLFISYMFILIHPSHLSHPTLISIHSRYKRSKILEAHTNSDPKYKNTESIRALITVQPGLESYLSTATVEELNALTPARRDEISRNEIQSTLKDNIYPHDKRDRVHRKQHGCMSFIEMGKLMSDAWKTIDPVSKAVFDDLSAQGRVVWQKKLEEYERNLGSKKIISATQVQALLQSGPGGGVSKEARGLEAGKSYTGSSSATKKRSKDSEEIQFDKPKRPLSAYNLYYRYKRTKVLKAMDTFQINNTEDNKDDITKKMVNAVITATPGLEDYPNMAHNKPESDLIKSICRTEIQSVLENKLNPSEMTKNRVHRKSHGHFNFTEMSKLMCESWKGIDAFTKSVFEELACKGRSAYEEKMTVYKNCIKEQNEVKKQKLVHPSAAAATATLVAGHVERSLAAASDYDLLNQLPTSALEAMVRQQQLRREAMSSLLASFMMPPPTQGAPARRITPSSPGILGASTSTSASYYQQPLYSYPRPPSYDTSRDTQSINRNTLLADYLASVLNSNKGDV